MPKTIAFTLDSSTGYYLSEAVKPEEDAVTLNVVMPSEENYILIVEHSIDQEHWQACGSRNFVKNTEVTIGGLRQEQYVRFKMLAAPESAVYI